MRTQLPMLLAAAVVTSVGLAATPEKLETISRIKVGDEVFATPTICGGRIYLRVANYDGETRKESLVCYGKK